MKIGKIRGSVKNCLACVVAWVFCIIQRIESEGPFVLSYFFRRFELAVSIVEIRQSLLT